MLCGKTTGDNSKTNSLSVHWTPFNRITHYTVFDTIKWWKIEISNLWDSIYGIIVKANKTIELLATVQRSNFDEKLAIFMIIIRFFRNFFNIACQDWPNNNAINYYLDDHWIIGWFLSLVVALIDRFKATPTMWKLQIPQKAVLFETFRHHSSSFRHMDLIFTDVATATAKFVSAVVVAGSLLAINVSRWTL